MIPSHHIFVFGSNLAGVHGAGAARHARRNYGAVFREGRGRTGDAYAIPTKDHNIETLPLRVIWDHVRDFVWYAREHPKLVFRVTRIGCGLAGYTDEDIAPMFQGCPKNCVLPLGWRPEDPTALDRLTDNIVVQAPAEGTGTAGNGLPG